MLILAIITLYLALCAACLAEIYFANGGCLKPGNVVAALLWPLLFMVAIAVVMLFCAVAVWRGWGG